MMPRMRLGLVVALVLVMSAAALLLAADLASPRVVDPPAHPAELTDDLDEQHRRRLVRPLQVIEHQHETATRGRLRQPLANVGEQREPLRDAGLGAQVGGAEPRRPQVSRRTGTDRGLSQHQPPQAVRR